MHLRTILNRHHKQPGFIYEQERIVTKDSVDSIVVPVRPRKGNKAICSGCGKAYSAYDTLASRYFEFVPFWRMRVFFEYAMRRVDCPTCGVTVEMVPWSDGKKHVTNMFFWFVAHWAGLLSRTEVSRQFSISWATVFWCVENAVKWGRKHMILDSMTAIGVDEIARANGHKYVTLVYQIDNSNKRLLWIGNQTVKAYLLKEQFQQLWNYVSPAWAGKSVDSWTFVAMRSKIHSIKKVARMIRKHKPLILNWFKAKGQISNGIVEGLNGKGRVITKRAYDFRTEKCLEVAVYHALGKLPLRKFTHRFW